MILIIIVLFVLLGISVLLLNYGNKGYDNKHLLATFFGIVGLVAYFFGLIAYSICLYYWTAAGHQAQIINREYGTNYTQEELFYAKNVIETVRQLDRQRYEATININKEDAK